MWKSDATFDHVGLTVADLDAAVGWYRRALGLVVHFEFAFDTFEFRAAMLIGPTGYRLELLERAGSAPGPAAANPIEAAAVRGYGHICLDVHDVDTAYAALLEAGAGERMSPRASPEAGVRMAFVADPEGNLIELIDRTAAAGRPPSERPAEAHVPVG
jgi:lactoylglutathione lyase